MKRVWMTIMIMATISTFTSTVNANTIKLFDTGNRYDNGGPFNAVLSAPDPGLVDTAFTTFCLEKNEYFYWGTSYNYTIDDSAHNGGKGGQDPPNSDSDPISAKTADLYYKLRTGSTFDLKALQAAFWYLEDELTLNPQTSYLPSSVEWLAWDYINNANGSFNNYGRVVVLNLYRVLPTTGATEQLQSQLGLARVPEPTSLLLLGLGLLGVGILRRKQ